MADPSAPAAPPPEARAVLAFWFGTPDDPGYAQPRQAWFRKDAAFDAEIARRFGALVERALGGGIDRWLTHPPQPLPALAQVIVLDQFTRNLFRGSARAFASDARALATATALVGAGADLALTGVQRQFVYLPFEHAEDLAQQRTALSLFAALERDEPALAGLLEWAQRHHDIIEQFGRFPHRNAALGRATTEEEQRFLEEGGFRG